MLFLYCVRNLWWDLALCPFRSITLFWDWTLLNLQCALKSFLWWSMGKDAIDANQQRLFFAKRDKLYVVGYSIYNMAGPLQSWTVFMSSLLPGRGDKCSKLPARLIRNRCCVTLHPDRQGSNVPAVSSRQQQTWTDNIAPRTFQSEKVQRGAKVRIGGGSYTWLFGHTWHQSSRSISFLNLTK